MKKIIIAILLLMFCLGLHAQSICVAADCKDTIKFPQITVTLNGHVTSPEGVKSVTWKTLTGISVIASPSIPATIATLTTPGLYVFQITGISNKGATGTAFDSVIYVGNLPPVCVMGLSVFTTVKTATLSGSASFDPEGLPLTYAWAQTSGPNTALITSPVIANPVVSNLVTGVYVFRLTVKDQSGLTATGTQIVTVALPITIVKTVTTTTIYYSDGSNKTTTTTVP